MAKKVIEINETPFYQPIEYSDSKNGLTSDTTFKFVTDYKTYVNFDPVATGNIRPTSYYVKDGDDLKYVVIYKDTDTNVVKKKLTMTVLGYAQHYEQYKDVMCNKGTQIETDAFYIQSTGKERLSANSLYAGTDKADQFTLAGGGSKVFDYKGNDSYNLASWSSPTSPNTITDYAGNDKYSFSVLPRTKINETYFGGTTNGAIYDYSGNDVYTAKDSLNKPQESGITANIHDYNGNDKYNFYSAQTVRIYDDGKGKDTYNFTDTDTANIYDWGGNDTYNSANSKIEIYENYAESSSKEKGTTGNETYNLNSLYAGSAVYDKLGNDKYNINYAYGTGENANLAITLSDATGKDTYKIAGSTYVDITDMGGNDNYTLTDSDNITLLDYIYEGNSGGNDSYTLKTVDNSEIDDRTGNDTYKIDSSFNTEIIDFNGTDKYTVAGSSGIKISDDTYANSGDPRGDTTDGNDTFIVKDSINTLLQSSYGNDKFTISDDAVRTTILENSGNETYTATDATLLKITDKAGDDTYKLTNVDNFNASVASADTDNGALDYNIKDSDGNDKYDIKDSRYITIYDDAATDNQKNTFNITSSTTTKLYAGAYGDKYSADTYNLSSNTNVQVIEYGASGDVYNLTSNKKVSVTEYGGDDTYNISKSAAGSTVSISEGFGNDTYNLDKMTGRTYLDDCNGNDTLNIKSGKAGDIVFMANATHDEGTVFAYDTKNGGFVSMESFYACSANTFIGDGVGKIETIKAGKSNLDVISISKLNELEATVSAFLTTGAGSEYGSIEDVLTSGDKEVINELVAYFKPEA